MSDSDDSYNKIIDKKNNTTYLIIRDKEFKPEYYKKEENENLTIDFNFEDLSKQLSPIDASNIILKLQPNSLKIENTLVESSNDNFLNNTKKTSFDILYISDECYSMSPILNDLFPSLEAETLILKKIKINSKKQLNNFLNFIKNSNCKKLFLEDIFIELLIKKDENDENFNVLDEYIGFENGKFYMKFGNEKKEINLKKLKLIDCPLFAITDDTFKDINNYKDIEIDIDENSLLNPSIITRFRINKGLSDFCFDLDSYKLNKEEDDDYIENLEYIINKIINNNNNEYNKLIFKNFDITKYEYITGENLTYIEEKNWILNEEEKERCKKFEEFDKKINEKIDKNLNKLSKVKSLVFDNCSNHFIQLILKFIKSTKNDLDLLKLKKCGKEHFNIKNILSLKINNLILFDTPLIIDSIPEKKENNLSKFNEQYGSIKNCTIKIASLEHYCKENNLDYCNSLEIILELITKKGYITDLIFEMNALPIIMTYLIAKKYCEKENKTKIPTYFEFTKLDNDTLDSKNEAEKKEKIKNKAIDGCKMREKLKSETFNIFNKEKTKIKLRKNYIKNKLENYDILTQYFVNEKGKELKIDFGSDVFNLDIDYRQFFISNEIKTIIFENCLFTNYTNTKLGDQSIIKETLFNLCKGSKEKCYKFDIKTINEVIFKNKGIEDLTYLFRFFSLEIEGKDLSSEIIDYLKNVKAFFDNLKITFKYLEENIKEITIIINNIKERKEFYCLMKVFELVEDGKSDINYKYKYHGNDNIIILPDKEKLKENLKKYFLIEQNEDEKDILSVYNYYYISDDEKDKFGDIGEKKKIEKCAFGNIHFNIKFKYEDPWKFIME